MKDRLVSNCIQILRRLFDGPTNVNSIIKETGLYKNNVFEANKTLKKAKLVTKNRKGKQTFILKLTELGDEVAKLMNSITEFNKSYAELASFIKMNFRFEDSDNKGLKNKLLAIDWKEDEIKHYSSIADAAHLCKEYSMNLLSEALITRYYLFFAKFRLNIEAKGILAKVITDSLSEQLLIRQHESEINTMGWTSNEVISKFDPSLFGWLEGGQVYPFGIAEHKTREIRNVCKSLLEVMAPPKEYVERDVLDKLSQDEDKSLISLYEEYLASS